MCQTALILNDIVRLSAYSFEQKVYLSVPQNYHLSQLGFLNRDLRKFYDLMYTQWKTITEEDYKTFGGKFEILLETISDLYEIVKNFPEKMGFGGEAEKLEMNYVALYELHSDIVNFCINLPHNSRIGQIMENASKNLNA